MLDYVIHARRRAAEHVFVFVFFTMDDDRYGISSSFFP